MTETRIVHDKGPIKCPKCFRQTYLNAGFPKRVCHMCGHIGDFIKRVTVGGPHDVR